MNNTQLTRLKEIQKANFAAYDMLLYLDTHCDDKKAFEIFRRLVEKTKSLKKNYEADYGPLTPYSTASQASFNWLKGPWPWEFTANPPSASQDSCSKSADSQTICPCLSEKGGE